MSNRTAPLACVRTQTTHLILAVARETGEHTAFILDRIFLRLKALYDVDIYQYPRQEDESLLAVAERFDLMDKVYTIAYAEYLYALSDGE